MKVAVLLSGGVDSSVALRLLKEEGHDLTAFYLKIWLEDELAHLGECPWEEDLSYARAVCRQAEVPLEVVPMQQEYWDTVVKYTIEECKAGRTPNPDIFCNQKVKFGHFFGKIDASFKKIATGHYARVEEADGRFLLKRAPDPVKDQTYFLSHLSQDQLARALFPLGKYSKAEVRQMAQRFDLPNRDRKDSQGICFLGKIPFRDFIREHLGEKPGDFVEKATGRVLGQHKGHWFYTVGQRFGLGLSGGPWFVVEKDLEQNRILLANGYEPEEVYARVFEVSRMNWISGAPDLRGSRTLQVRIRHGATLTDCAVPECVADAFRVTLHEPLHGVAEGQFAVFYDGEVCLGGGMIASVVRD